LPDFETEISESSAESSGNGKYGNGGNGRTAATRLRRRHVTRVASRNAFSSRILIAVIMTVQSTFQLLAEHPTLSNLTVAQLVTAITLARCF